MNSELTKLEKEKNKAISLGKWKEAGDVCNYIGSELSRVGQYEEALEFHKEELNFNDIIQDSLGIAVANRKIGECHAELGYFQKALDYIKKFLDIAVKDLHCKVEEQRAWATLGRTFYLKFLNEPGKDSSKKILDQAEQAYLRALELSEDIKSKVSSKEYAEMRARCLLNLGLVCEHRGNISQCAENIRHAIFLATKYGLHEDLNRCQSSLASVYQKHGEYTLALRLLDGAIATAEKLKDKTLLCDELTTKANILISLKDFDGAKQCLKKAYKVHTPIESDHEKVTKLLKTCSGLCLSQKKLLEIDTECFQERKEILEKMADSLSSLEFYKLALEFYTSTLQCMENYDCSVTEKAPIYFSIALTYKDMGNLSKALEFLKMELNCNESQPSEQVKTWWKIAETLEEMADITEAEKTHLKAISVSQSIGNIKLEMLVLQKLLSFYERTSMLGKAGKVKEKLKDAKFRDISDEESGTDDEESEDAFGDIRLSELSDWNDSDIENKDAPIKSRRRMRKPATKVNDKGETPLHQACINGNYTVVKRLVESGHCVNTRDFCGWTPLHEACNHGHFEIVEYLLDKNASVNDRGGSHCGGITPLHDAASNGHLNIVQLLLSRGASVVLLDDNGETPLQAFLKWKMDHQSDLESEELKLCSMIENDFRKKMTQAGQPAKETELMIDEQIGFDDVMMPSFDHLNSLSSQRSSGVEKRARSSSSEQDSDELEAISPYEGSELLSEWNDAKDAQSEYQSVMSNLRRSAKSNIPSVSPLKPNKIPGLVNEQEVVNDWLISDTKRPEKLKRKRRKVPRLNVRTSRSLYNYLEPKENNEQEAVIIDSSSDFSNDAEPAQLSQNSQVEDNVAVQSNRSSSSSKLAFVLKVRINNKLILVPVPDDSLSVAWLTSEASQRYHDLMGSRPHLTLMTKDGALLSKSDLLITLFSNNDEVLSTVESMDEPLLVERYSQLCLKRENKPLASIKERLVNFENSAELNFSNCVISNQQISLIFSSLHPYKNLQHLNISNTMICDTGASDVMSAFPSFTSLVSLDMSSCGLTSETLNKFSDYLNRQSCPDHKLPNLSILRLNGNVFFTPQCRSHITTILDLSSLTVLGLSSCSLYPSLLESSELCNKLETCFQLQEFNISGNILSEQSITNYLKYIPRSNLRKLDLSHTLSLNGNLGKKVCDYLSNNFPFLTDINFEDCHLKDEDLVSIQSNICCQFFSPKSLNLSVNPHLTCDAICLFLKRTSVCNTDLTDILLCGTCIWDNKNTEELIRVIQAMKNLKFIMLDRISVSAQEELFKFWQSRYGKKSLISTGEDYCYLSTVP